MTKKEIFDKIVMITAEVNNVSYEDIMNGCRKEDVVVARAICVFWLTAAGFSVESMMQCTETNNANSINSIKARIEMYWSEKFAFHVLVKEVGKRLLEYAHSIEEDFDIWKPINQIRKFTGMY